MSSRDIVLEVDERPRSQNENAREGVEREKRRCWCLAQMLVIRAVVVSKMCRSALARRRRRQSMSVRQK